MYFDQFCILYFNQYLGRDVDDKKRAIKYIADCSVDKDPGNVIPYVLKNLYYLINLLKKQRRLT